MIPARPDVPGSARRPVPGSIRPPAVPAVAPWSRVPALRVVLPAAVCMALLLPIRGPAPASAASPGEAVGQDTTDSRDEIPPPPPAWQQGVRYTVEARLDEEAGALRAAQRVRYENASPDTLRRLYFHLHLNAFRPNSLWARNERRERFDFQSLEEPDYGYERLGEVRLLEGPGVPGPPGSRPGPEGAEEEAREGERAAAGRPLRPVYPHRPDSTVVRLDLPEPLPPGAALTLHMTWEARPSTLCRRQCRQGRSWDFAQWYPRVAVYDGGGWQAHPLYPQGEFYGEFATYEVTLDLAGDQVVGATGVPVSGDPGWVPAETSPRPEPLYRRDAYPDRGDPASVGLLDGSAEPGRRRVRFRAEDVHHFAWSVSPEYVYEGDVYERGDLPDVAIHVLYRPGDDDWDEGVVLERSIRALSWLETIFRPYPYPQFTNLHRLEGGGTEFPMLVMNGSASEGLIVHEATHQYAHGILASNEWREAWLDEGLTTFLTSWYAEEHGARDPWSDLVRGVGAFWGRRAESAAAGGRAPKPIATVSEEFADYSEYGAMSYTVPSAVFYMLREMLGKETLRRILRTYYDRHEFRHVNEAAFRRVAEEVSGRELDWFFEQWLHGFPTLDYRIGEVSTEETSDGRWRTRVEVVREGEAWMPVTVATDAGGRARITDRARRQTVELVTDERPTDVTVDPGLGILDVDRSDNHAEVEGPGEG